MASDKTDIIDIYQALSIVQANLKCPKGKYNNFGKYNYRTKEDLQKGFKEIALDISREFDQPCTLIVSDDIVLIGDRFYVKATATFSFAGDCISATAWAREPEVKKGMDASQITGSASSYAGKYAIGNLFLCDDSAADPDHGNEESNTAPTTRHYSSNHEWGI